MSDPTIFGSNPPGGNPTDPPAGSGTPAHVQIDPAIATLLGEIKNERGEPKYKDLQAAIVALKHSQEYIPTLTGQLTAKEAELAQARADAARVAELERSIEALTNRQATPSNTTAPVFDESKIAEMVTRQLTQAEQARVAQSNTALVADTLKHALGTEAEAKYNEKAAELGMSVQELNALVARSPKAVLTMFGVQAKPTTAAPNAGSINTSGLAPHQDTFVGRNKEPVVMGATTEDMRRESDRSKRMVEELNAQGLSVHDLSDPKLYKKYFGA